MLDILPSFIGCGDKPVVLSGLDGLEHLCHNCFTESSKWGWYTPVVETLTTALGSIPEIQLKSIQILTDLCIADDQVFRDMRFYSTVQEVRMIMSKDNPDLVEAGLLFFLRWIKQTTGYKDFLFGEIACLDFPEISQHTRFEAKCVMVELVMELCNNAEDLKVAELIRPRVLEIFWDLLNCVPEDLGSAGIYAIGGACEKASGNVEFLRMVRESLGDVVLDSEKNSGELEELRRFVEGLLGLA
jgi:hypothetical protein